MDETQLAGKSAWDLCLLLKTKGLLVGRALKIAHVQGAQANARSSSQAKPTHVNIIRLAPPLVITEDQILKAVRIVGEAIEELTGSSADQVAQEAVPEEEKGVAIGLEN